MKTIGKVFLLIFIVGMAFAACDIAVDTGGGDSSSAEGDGDSGDGDGDIGDGDGDTPPTGEDGSYTLTIVNATVGYINVSIDGGADELLVPESETEYDAIILEFDNVPDKVSVLATAPTAFGLETVVDDDWIPTTGESEEEIGLYLYDSTFSLWMSNSSSYTVNQFFLNFDSSSSTFEGIWDITPISNDGMVYWVGFMIINDLDNYGWWDGSTSTLFLYQSIPLLDENEWGSQYGVTTLLNSAAYSGSVIYPTATKSKSPIKLTPTQKVGIKVLE